MEVGSFFQNVRQAGVRLALSVLKPAAYSLESHLDAGKVLEVKQDTEVPESEAQPSGERSDHEVDLPAC
jgi:hypothetical protein